MKKKYSIFGAGAAGLYTAWRLLSGQKGKEKGSTVLSKGDTLELYDWGNYDFSKADPGSREASGRVCTYHYENDKNKSFVELGGMRYSYWDGNNDASAPGHRLVTQTIADLDLTKYSIPFDESSNPLYFLRAENIYNDDISSTNPVPYNIKNYSNGSTPDTGFTTIQNIAMSREKATKMTRVDWCRFYQKGEIASDLPESSVFQKGDLLKDIGYWNLMFDQLGSEGYLYSAAGNGYTSNVINWNSAEAIDANNEFVPGSEYKTLSHGYSTLLSALFKKTVELAKEKGVQFNYYPDTRVRSIRWKGDKAHFTTATRKQPTQLSGKKETDFAWLAMPRAALEKVAEATRYEDVDGLDVLNHEEVQLYLESAIIQPSYKIGMFFHEEWWKEGSSADPKYPAQLSAYNITEDVLKKLAEEQFSQGFLKLIAESGDAGLLNTSITPAETFIQKIEVVIDAGLDYQEQQQILNASERDTIGPSTTDTPIRQIVYFGNNAPDPEEKNSSTPIYGILGSYDDEQFASFWKELELSPNQTKKKPESADTQPLDGPRDATKAMVKMLRKQMATVHFGPQAEYDSVPEPLETKFMDWSLPPFYAGYHAYAAHYDIGDVQQKIRKPSQLIKGEDANIFIVGEAYSNDQAWVEGAFCTAESVLNDFFEVEPIIDNKHYPFICGDTDGDAARAETN